MKTKNRKVFKQLNCDELCFISTKKPQEVEDLLIEKECEVCFPENEYAR